MHLSGLIKETIREHAGLDVNAHLFRSIAAKLHNRAAPGDLVTISHVIGDRIQTVMRGLFPVRTIDIAHLLSALGRGGPVPVAGRP